MPKRFRSEARSVFADRLRERRTQLGIDQKTLCEMLGYTHSALPKYESGDLSPNVDTLLKLAEALDCTTDYLLGRTNMPDYVLVKGEALPRELRDMKVDAVEVLRTQVQADGGISPAAQREVLRIVSNAKLLTRLHSHQSTPDSRSSNDIPPK